MNDVTKILSRRLKMLSYEKGCTMKQIANSVGCPDSSVCRWLNGKRIPKADSIAKLAVYIDVSADYLLGLSDKKEREK